MDLKNNYEIWLYRRQLLSSMAMVDYFNKALEFLRPDKVLIVHGVYLIHGIVVDVCAQKSVDVTVWGMPYRKGTLLFSHKETYHRSLVDEPADSWNNITFSPSMAAELDDYVNAKTLGGRENVNYHPNPIFDKEVIINSLKLDPNKPIISMYTNVIWDAQIYYQYNAFDNIFDWIFSTIKYFKSRQDLQLVIRIHPAEKKGGYTTRQPLYPEIMKKFPILPENVFIIPAESDLSSYTLVEMSQAALIYGTKMGVEIAIRGIPVIVAGETFNRGKGFTYDVETREQYFRLLDGILNLPRNNEEMIMAARKFFYYLFFLRMIDFPLINLNAAKATREQGERFYNFDSLADLMPGRERNLDLICDGILHGRPFHVTPDK
ncbi:MAG: hypothetical protein ACYDIC_01165 [Desulfobaccales bacterium]